MPYYATIQGWSIPWCWCLMRSSKGLKSASALCLPFLLAILSCLRILAIIFKQMTSKSTSPSLFLEFPVSRFSFLLSVSMWINCRSLNSLCFKTELLIFLQILCLSYHHIDYSPFRHFSCIIFVTVSFLTLISNELLSPASQYLWTPIFFSILTLIQVLFPLSSASAFQHNGVLATILTLLFHIYRDQSNLPIVPFQLYHCHPQDLYWLLIAHIMVSRFFSIVIIARSQPYLLCMPYVLAPCFSISFLILSSPKEPSKDFVINRSSHEILMQQIHCVHVYVLYI